MTSLQCAEPSTIYCQGPTSTWDHRLTPNDLLRVCDSHLRLCTSGPTCNAPSYGLSSATLVRRCTIKSSGFDDVRRCQWLQIESQGLRLPTATQKLYRRRQSGKEGRQERDTIPRPLAAPCCRTMANLLGRSTGESADSAVPLLVPQCPAVVLVGLVGWTACILTTSMVFPCHRYLGSNR